MKNKIMEHELIERIIDIFDNVSPEDFLEEFNKIAGTDYKLNDIEWDK